MILFSLTVLLNIQAIFASPVDFEGSQGLVPNFNEINEISSEISEILDSSIRSVVDVDMDSIGKVVNVLTKSGDSVKNVIDMLNRTIPTEAIVLDTEKVIITLTEGITEISDKHKTYAGEALRDMIWIKHNLRTSRLGLEDLAHRTISTVDELAEYSEYRGHDSDHT